MESNVLRKVASLTYELAVEQKQASIRMRTPPERQDFRSAETFEGQFVQMILLTALETIWHSKF